MVEPSGVVAPSMSRFTWWWCDADAPAAATASVDMNLLRAHADALVAERTGEEAGWRKVLASPEPRMPRDNRRAADIVKVEKGVRMF